MNRKEIRKMADMVKVYLYGKEYEVPASLTIMEAFEYSGYQLVRGCGCRNGFCVWKHNYVVVTVVC